MRRRVTAVLLLPYAALLLGLAIISGSPGSGPFADCSVATKHSSCAHACTDILNDENTSLHAMDLDWSGADSVCGSTLNPSRCHAPQVINPDEPGGMPGQPLEYYLKYFTPASGERLGTVAACFAPGTPPEVVDFVEAAIYGGGGQRYNLTSRWNPNVQGQPKALTWSFVPDGLTIPGPSAQGGINEPTSPSNLFATLDAAFASQGGRATWILRFQQVFDRWSQLTGLTYTRVTFGGNDWDDGSPFHTSPAAAGLRGDVRIGAHSIDGASNVLAYNQFPQDGDMVLDSDDSANWASGGPPSIQVNRFLRNVVAHEHGHGIGLLHVCPATSAKLMEPFISTTYDGPRQDDNRAAQRHYGDRFEDNNNAGQAFAIGTVDVGSPIHFGDTAATVSGYVSPTTSLVSIDADGEEDWWKFHIDGARVASATVTPIGNSYASYAQDANCNNTVQNTNGLNIANLAVSIVGTDGTTVLGDASSQGVGVAETVSNVCLSGSGDYYVKVYETDSPTGTQLYKFDVSVTCPTVSVNPIANASTVCGSPYSSASPTASTSCGGVTWSLGGSPPTGMTIDSNTGIVSWPIPLTSPTPYSITVQAGNGCNSASQSYNLSVLVGDFNGDGVLDDLDVPDLANHLLGLDTSRICAADVNGDSLVDGLDLAAWVDLAQ